ncbi:DUF1499 domain-containing protein [Cetobacterium sp. 8H]|uniref:DUF1499 domain-containing protein n=1 Tax=Cetobacterium sp. 8H TaxID=2759681 RepID=UPI00163BAF77|nr:DUF1499 domain-containing protein [Cetobacterium sp. 8H]MBC2851556.1 DUF1499 domain-containing protein [Cetobacterium sp. 8H]
MKKIILFLICILIFSCSSASNLKEGDMKFSSCPNTPNCVISDIEDKDHYIEPLSFKEQSLESINKKLVEVLKGLGGEVVENKGDYVKANFKSKFFKFEDIAEFNIDLSNKKIYVRSAAQTGWYDFGVNRKRMEKIREKL